MNADLVVVTQESSILTNYLLQLKRGRPVLAYWGHGRNFQSSSPNGALERWKSFWVNKIDWWFAYTQLSVDWLLSLGFPAGKITNLQNAIDTNSFRTQIRKVSESEVMQARHSLGIPRGARIGIFCGSLYAHKLLKLLVSAAELIRAAIPDFHLVIIGGGPEATWLTSHESTNSWLHLTGPLHGKSKAVWYRTASVALNPGGVGLGVLDAFSAGLPLVAVQDGGHGPEIAYLKHGVNGLLTETSASAYADSVIRLLKNPEERFTMGRRALGDSSRYTVENMAIRFARGIEQALAPSIERSVS